MRVITAAASLALLLAISTASAQTRPGVVGVGVSLSPTALLMMSEDGEGLFLPVGFTNIHIPITPVANFRIEPEFGIYSTSNHVEGTDSIFSSTLDQSFSATRLGTGIYYRMPMGDAFATYVGPRVGAIMMSEEREESFMGERETRKESATHLVIGAALGGEYLISEHFGVGAEVQLNYLSLGEPTIERTPSTPPTGGSTSLSRSLITSNTLIHARFYF